MTDELFNELTTDFEAILRALQGMVGQPVVVGFTVGRRTVGSIAGFLDGATKQPPALLAVQSLAPTDEAFRFELEHEGALVGSFALSRETFEYAEIGTSGVLAITAPPMLIFVQPG